MESYTLRMADASPADLVRRAFQLARDSGKEEWRKMTIPVLKNRILMVTGGHFREPEFGAHSFREFLGGLPEGLITLDESQSPGFVIFGAESSAGSAPRGGQFSRIRSDLWRAALDYSSGRRYIWDSSTNQARAATGESGPFMPTVTADEFRAWRAQFAAANRDAVAGDSAVRLQRWASESLPTAFLPARLRPLWNAELKKQVETRLQPWFAANGIQVPPDLKYAWQEPPEKSSLEHLRQFAINCVRAMTEEELSELKIPARVAMRVRLNERP